MRAREKGRLASAFGAAQTAATGEALKQLVCELLESCPSRWRRCCLWITQKGERPPYTGL